MARKLIENFECNGIANLAADKRTLQLVASEYSPLIASEMKSEATFTGIPGKLARDMLNDLFFFSSCVSSDGSPSPS